MKKIHKFYFILLSSMIVMFVNSEKNNLLLSNDTLYKKCQFFILKNNYKEVQDASLLINDNISLSLDICRKSLESDSLSFYNFSEYVLPHRLGFEKLVFWRSDCLKKYKHLLKNKYNSLDERNLDYISKVNKDLIGTFTYSSKYKPAKLLNWSELIRMRRGDCWAMANTITYPLRALGVPVAVDYCNIWGNVSGGGHCWNVYIRRNKKNIPFMGFEGSPHTYNPFRIYKNLYRIPPKVYRLNYSISENSVGAHMSINNVIPFDSSLLRVLDVTSEYFKTYDIVLKNNNVPKKNILYLSVYNNGFWEPAFWSQKNINTYRFSDMNSSLLYIQSTFDGNRFNDIGNPLFLIKEKVKFLNPNYNKRIVLKLKHSQSAELEAQSMFGRKLSDTQFYNSMDSISLNKKRSRYINGKIYILHFWDKGWKFISKQECFQNTITFPNVPSNALYRVSRQGVKDEKIRVFSYMNDKQIWW